MLTPQILTQSIKAQAAALGFSSCHLIPVYEAPHADFFEAWVAAGRPGEMAYLARNSAKRRTPQLLVEEGPAAQSMIVLAVSHYQFDLPAAWRDDPSRGLIASYAWGDDYHELIRPQLYALDGFIREQSGRTTPGKCLVDTGPVLERDWAQQAGLGFVGKNCCLIHPTHGSWLLLATILIPEVVAYDPPLHALQPEPTSAAVLNGLPPTAIHGRWQHTLTSSSKATLTCGRCTRCLDDCPTNAFVGPYHLDPQRCISYWTIEAKGSTPRELRPAFGNRIFGCDICQEVCPWNQRLPATAPLLPGLTAQADRIAPPLLEGFASDTPYWLVQEAFSRRFRRSPIKRAKRAGMLRNVCVALGNWGVPATLPALAAALADETALVRGHAAWAVGQCWQKTGDSSAQRLLQEQLVREHDEEVLMELHAALNG